MHGGTLTQVNEATLNRSRVMFVNCSPAYMEIAESLPRVVDFMFTNSFVALWWEEILLRIYSDTSK